jgi:hypothetical protein
MMESHSPILPWANDHLLKNQNLRGITNVSPPDEWQREDHRFFSRLRWGKMPERAEPETLVAPMTTG